MSATFSAVRLARWVSHRLPAMVLLAAALPLLGACDSFRSAFKIHDIDPKKSFAQSANLRNVYAKERVTDVNKEKIICPEPSPDALAVAASSFGISVGIPGKGGGSAGGGGAAPARLEASREVPGIGAPGAVQGHPNGQEQRG